MFSQLPSVFSFFKKDPFKDTFVLESGPKKAYHRKYRKHASANLRANLDVAEWLFNKVKAKVPYSPNYQSRTFGVNDPTKKDVCSTMRLKEWCKPYPSGTISLRALKFLEKNKSGVCEDLALAGIIYTMQHHIKINVERVNIRTGRHTFLIIGRDKNTDPHNYKTWGKDCVVCDIWAGKYYPLTEFENEIYCYVSNYKYSLGAERKGESEITCPRVRLFDPSSDRAWIWPHQLTNQEQQEIIDAHIPKEKRNTRKAIITTKSERIAIAETLKQKR